MPFCRYQVEPDLVLFFYIRNRIEALEMEKKNRRVSCVLPVLSDYTAKGTSYVYSHLVI
jgi:hypothetical protein